jgi:hypothetical protein
VLAAIFGFVGGCGETDDGAVPGNDAGSAGQSVSGAGGVASAGKSGAGSAGSSAGTESAGASGRASGGAGTGTIPGGGSPGAPADAGASGAGGSPRFDCDAKKVTCKIAVPACPDFEVPAVDGTCWGECVEIARCACSEASDCPDTNQYTCWSKRHCGPYVL